MSDTVVEQTLQDWQKRFFTIWSGQAASLLGSQVVQFALVWWLTKTTGSAVVLSTASMMAILPQVFLGPFVGVLVDRWPRRLVMIVADSLNALLLVLLAGLFWGGLVHIWHIFGLIFLRSVLGTFHYTAMQSSTSLMVPKEQLGRIQGLNQMLQGLTTIGAAPLGALAMSLLPMQGVLLIDVVTAAIAVAPLFFFSIPQPARAGLDQPAAGVAGVLSDLHDGVRYVWTWRGLTLLMGMAMLINLLLVPSGTLQPLLVTQYFHGDAGQLALLEAAFGVGMVAGGLGLGVWGGFKRRMLTSLLGLVIFGAVIAGVGFVPASMFWMVVVLMFMMGVASPITNGPIFAVLQSVVMPEMQGRVMTLLNSACMAMMPVGLMLAGPLAERFGVRAWYVGGGVATLLLGMGAFFVPALIDIDQGHAAQPKIAAAPQAAVIAAAPAGEPFSGQD